VVEVPSIRCVDGGLVVEAPSYEVSRLTIPCHEALERASNRVEDAGHTYRITLAGRIPLGVIEAVLGAGTEQHRGLRLDIEPPYPGEWPEDAVAWYERGQWVPCPAPHCGRALVWYEAGYVPGYRVCTRGHHAQLSDDGRAARPVRD
jgi:hypothetical protein